MWRTGTFTSARVMERETIRRKRGYITIRVISTGYTGIYGIMRLVGYTIGSMVFRDYTPS